SFVKPEYLKKAKQANPRLYDIGCYNDNLALMLSPESDEVIRLEKESRSKLSDLIRPFDYAKLNSIYDLFIPQREKSSEQCYFLERSRVSHIIVQKEKKSFNKQPTLLEKRLDESIPLGKQCSSSLELFNVIIQATTIFKGVEMCKNSITKSTYFGYLDPFIKNTIEQNFSPEIERILTGLNQFQRWLKEKMVDDLRYFNSLEFEDLKAQLQDKGIVISELKKLTKKLKGKSVNTKFEKSSVIRQPNAFKSQRPLVLGKSTTFSNSFIRKDFSKSTSVTKNNVSNDFSKPVTAHTLPTNKKPCLKNTNVLAPGMYKLHTDHTQARTSKLPQDSKKTNKRGDRVMHNNSQGKKLELEEHRRNVKLSKNKTSVTVCNDSLNAKTLNVKYVSTKCDKCVLIDKHDMCVLKSVAKPLKETVASESNKKPRNNVRKLYERLRKIYKWSYVKFTPSGYMWKPKSPTGNVNPNLIEIVLFIVDSGCSKHMTGNLLYDIGCYNDNLALMLSPESDEVIRLEKESRSKLSDLIRPFDYTKLNSLYDLFVPQREKSSEQRFFLERSRISHINVQNAKKKEFFQKQTTFLEKRMDESIQSKSVTENNVSNDFSKQVTAQTLPTNKKPCLKNANVLAPGMYKLHTDHTQARTSKLPQDSKKTNKRVLFSTGVIPTTSVSRPQLKSNPQGDRVMHNNSRGKK
nr:hypothetical protein [Tanacetum cinerariifolium]